MSPFNNENSFDGAAGDQKLTTVPNDRVTPACTLLPLSDFVYGLAKRRPKAVLLKPRNLHHSWTTMPEPCVNCVGAGQIVFGSDIPAIDSADTFPDVFTVRIIDGDKEHILRYHSLGILGES